MQPLRAMNNVQKARLLHALLMYEIPAFLVYTQQLCTYMRENPDEVRKPKKLTGKSNSTTGNWKKAVRYSATNYLTATGHCTSIIA
eukprot:gene21330-25706_t